MGAGAGAGHDRFGFGENWTRFLTVLTPKRIEEAERSLQHMLGVTHLKGLRFLDVGCGSGLFSLAAARLGAARVHSFDYDIKSVRCAEELKRRFHPPAEWTIERGSVLDDEYLSLLGQWDTVYSWGVLHHTGSMWKAIANVTTLVRPGGRLFISIYNDQGARSKLWTIEKRMYVRYPVLRPLLVGGFMLASVTLGTLIDLRRGRVPWRRYLAQERGMSWYHDLVDWLGGYPFEVARPDAVQTLLRERGFTLDRLVTRTTSGCNEYVFRAPPLLRNETEPPQICAGS
jgi:SAM-dependent methyltransferase